MRQLGDKKDDQLQETCKNISGGSEAVAKQGNTIMLLPWLSELHVSGSGDALGAPSWKPGNTPQGLHCYACCDLWDCSLAVAK